MRPSVSAARKRVGSNSCERLVPTQTCPGLQCASTLSLMKPLVARGVQHLHRHRIGLRQQLLQAHRLDVQPRPDRGGVVDGRVVADQPRAQRVQHRRQGMGRGRQPQDADDAAVQLAPEAHLGVALAGQRGPMPRRNSSSRLASRYSALDRTLAVLAWMTRTGVRGRLPGRCCRCPRACARPPCSSGAKSRNSRVTTTLRGSTTACSCRWPCAARWGPGQLGAALDLECRASSQALRFRNQPLEQ
jgi:hypothetical protein